jgi:hypothetical protein
MEGRREGGRDEVRLPPHVCIQRLTGGRLALLITVFARLPHLHHVHAPGWVAVAGRTLGGNWHGGTISRVIACAIHGPSSLVTLA